MIINIKETITNVFLSSRNTLGDFCVNEIDVCFSENIDIKTMATFDTAGSWEDEIFRFEEKLESELSKYNAKVNIIATALLPNNCTITITIPAGLE